nr:hypothetical protein CFP56_13692 [Quercus suber]
MTTRFSKHKLAKAQEKKAKGGTVNGLLSKKKAGYVVKKDPVITPSPTHSPAKCPASPTSALEMIVSGGEETRKKKKVLGESLFISRKLLDLEKKVVTSKPLVKSLSTKNETLKNKVAILTTKAENEKEHVATLEKSLQVEKDFCKLKDKQIGDLELKLQNYYVEGFDLLMKWMARHRPCLDLSGLAVDDIKKELMFDHPYKVTVENVTEEAIDVAEVMKETLANPILDEQ